MEASRIAAPRDPARSALELPPIRENLLSAAQPGEWFRMVLHDQWAVARVTWRSDNGRFFMFASQLAGRSHSLSRGALERLIERGQFKRLRRAPQALAASGR